MFSYVPPSVLISPQLENLANVAYIKIRTWTILGIQNKNILCENYIIAVKHDDCVSFKT